MTTGGASGETPRLSYWHLWADAGGVSRHTLCTLSAFTSSVLGPGDSPQWNDAPLLEDGNAFLTVLPVG